MSRGNLAFAAVFVASCAGIVLVGIIMGAV
jgi:hypothetical protein